jgi:hypothetical protein
MWLDRTRPRGGAGQGKRQRERGGSYGSRYGFNFDQICRLPVSLCANLKDVGSIFGLINRARYRSGAKIGLQMPFWDPEPAPTTPMLQLGARSKAAHPTFLRATQISGRPNPPRDPAQLVGARPQVPKVATKSCEGPRDAGVGVVWHELRCGRQPPPLAADQSTPSSATVARSWR